MLLAVRPPLRPRADRHQRQHHERGRMHNTERKMDVSSGMST